MVVQFKFISVPHILLLGTSFSTAHAYHCIHQAYGADIKVMHFSLNAHPFCPKMDDYRARGSYSVRNPLVISDQDKGVDLLTQEQVKHALLMSDVVHLNVPLLDTIWTYLDLVITHAKPGAIFITPHAQDPVLIEHLRLKRPDIKVACFEIFPALVGGGQPYELRSEKSSHRVWISDAATANVVLPYLARLYSGMLFPIIQHKGPVLVNGANPSYHPKIHYDHVAQSVKKSVGESFVFDHVPLAIQNQLSLFPVTKNPLFYLEASSDITESLYLVGNELHLLQGYLRRLDDLFPDIIRRIDSEYQVFFKMLQDDPELRAVIHPKALEFLSDPCQYREYLTHPAMMYSGLFMAAHYGHITGVSFPQDSHITKSQVLNATSQWLVKEIYGRTKLPLNADGTIQLYHRFIEEDVRIIMRNMMMAMTLGLTNPEEKLPELMKNIRCYQAQKQVIYFDRGQFTPDAYLLVFRKPVPPTLEDVASWVLSVPPSHLFSSKL